MKLIETENNNEGMVGCCLVCGAFGAGNYYNSYTCYQCKEFFESQKYILCLWRCPNGNNRCEITQTKKEQCRVCWMVKCIRAGMKLYLSDFDKKADDPNKYSPERKQ